MTNETTVGAGEATEAEDKSKSRREAIAAALVGLDLPDDRADMTWATDGSLVIRMTARDLISTPEGARKTVAAYTAASRVLADGWEAVPPGTIARLRQTLGEA